MPNPTTDGMSDRAVTPASGLPPAPPPTPSAPVSASAPASAATPAGTAAPSPVDTTASAPLSQPSAAPEATLPPLRIGPSGRLHIDDLLRYVVDVKASDLHIKPGSPPTIRINGLLEQLEYHVLDPHECHEMARAMMAEKERDDLEEWGETDFAYSLAGVGRFRVNAHNQRGSLGIAARRILPHAPKFADLGLPSAVEQLANEHRGLFLVTGPTSSGKTTTCGAVVRHINQTRRCHIVTIEDPIEILHNDDKAIVTQREIGQDTKSFARALRAAMRQDPDVIFVGEIRDIDTVQAALQAAETGHFVLATLHTTDAVETVNRIVDFFPSHQQKQVRVALGSSLVGTITQRLLPRIGGGRAPAIEVMIANGRIRDCILDPDRTHQIHDIIEESGSYGMQTFDQALVKIYQQGLVSLEDARSAANSPHDLELALQKAGLLRV